MDGASRDRTGDLLLAKQALSQLSYGPARDSSLELRFSTAGRPDSQPSKSKSRGGRCSNQRRSCSGASCKNSGVSSSTSSPWGPAC
jgi:hypothetical protein